MLCLRQVLIKKLVDDSGPFSGHEKNSLELDPEMITSALSIFTFNQESQAMMNILLDEI